MLKLHGKKARAPASVKTIDYKVQSVPISDLCPNPGNVRTHSKRQVRQIANSINAFGCLVPALIDENNMIIAGHGRIEAAKYLGMRMFPVLRVEHLTEPQKRAYILADNKLAQNAGWDRERLYGELKDLSVILIDEDLDVELTGFDTAELDAFYSDFQNTSRGGSETLPPLSADPVCRRDDLWKLGEHRVAWTAAARSWFSRTLRTTSRFRGMSVAGAAPNIASSVWHQASFPLDNSRSSSQKR